MNDPIQILIVDDNPYFIQAAREFLLIQGGLPLAEVATNAQDAVSRALELKPDLILLDVNLAGQSGLGLIPAFKQKLPGTRIIAMTMMSGEYRQPALQAGADAFVLKNDVNMQLLRLISEMMKPPVAPPSDHYQFILRSGVEEQVRFLAAQVEHPEEAIILSDASYLITAWSPGAEAMYGWKAEEALGQNGLELLQTQYLEGNKDKMLVYIAKTGGYRGEVTQARKNGTRFLVQVSSFVFRDEQGQITGYGSVNRAVLGE